MVKVFFKIVIILFFFSNIIFSQTVAHTVRCRDGVVLILGKGEGILKTKELIKTIDKNTTTEELVKIIKEKNISEIEELKSYQEYNAAEKEKEIPEYYLATLSIKDAQENGVIPYISNLSLFDAKNILESYGYLVFYREKPIGKTGIYPPVDIFVQSAGLLSGSNYAKIYVDNLDLSKNSRGYNIVVLDKDTGSIKHSVNFDTFLSKENSYKMKEFIKQLHDGDIVICAVKDEASRELLLETVLSLRTIGAISDLRKMWRYSHAIIGIKGIKQGSAQEEMKNSVIEIFATKKRCDKEIGKLISSGRKIIILPEKLLPYENIQITIKK